jgi:hypothetical protein
VLFDVFVAAVAQVRDPNLPIEQRQWWLEQSAQAPIKNAKLLSYQ